MTGTHDPLRDVSDQLASLDEQPVETHPDALEAVHRAVVGELDALARIGKAADAGADRDTA